MCGDIQDTTDSIFADNMLGLQEATTKMKLPTLTNLYKTNHYLFLSLSLKCMSDEAGTA